MRLVSFSPDGEQMLRSGIETAAGIADTRQVAELAGLGEHDRIALTSTRAAVALDRERLATLGQTAEWLTSELRERGAFHGRDHVHLGRRSRIPRRYLPRLELPRPRA
jgi:hypothetical protein